MVAKSVARAGPLRRGVRPRIPTLQRLLYGQPDQLTLTVLGRDVCPFGLTSIVKEQLFQRGAICCDDNRLAISVQTHFFDSGSAAAVGGQEQTGPTLFARLATGGGRWTTSKHESRRRGETARRGGAESV